MHVVRVICEVVGPKNYQLHPLWVLLGLRFGDVKVQNLLEVNEWITSRCIYIFKFVRTSYQVSTNSQSLYCVKAISPIEGGSTHALELW